MKKFLILFLSILMPLIVGGVSGYFTSSSIPTWYASLQKPSFNPPNFLFAPVWTTLYILMGIAVFMIWNQKTILSKTKAYVLWGVQLFINFWWSIIFFYFESPKWALVEIIFMWFFILFTILEFRKINKISGLLLIPYLLWVSFATVLNAAIFVLN
ncbi:MAG: hypothetical protein RLZZ546_2220 [Bacteroidota bacterium]|jgi:tryptophan-rich sensory protein